ncbi:hypothetical protein DF18_07145 [Streptomyces rimosus]|nr:hypothetical protein DF18_07145 [Streptomyces rimosus]
MASACTVRPSSVPIPSSRTASAETLPALTPLCEKLPKTQMKAPNVAITMMLLRTGVHIIAPNRPRALRICPSTTCTPMKNMVGRQ